MGSVVVEGGRAGVFDGAVVVGGDGSVVGKGNELNG